jgi:tetratricopeptide (TPR) repeat protein
MHALRLGVAVLMFGLAVGQEARAGIYNLDEPKSDGALYPPYREKGNPLLPKWVQIWRGDLAGVDDALNQPPPEGKDQPKTPPKKESLLRLAFKKQAAELKQREQDGKLSPTELVSLSGCLLRLGRWQDAMKVLEERLRTIPEEEPARFLLLLNLATAYWQNEDLRLRAIDKQTEALKAWPDRWRGWDRATWEWYRWAEKYNLELMRLRHREAGGPAGTLDALFPKVRFTGPAGKYEVGSIALEQWNELPRDAEQLVIQLMLWQPRDNRLYWLYGELLNARGEVQGAYDVLDSIVRTGQNAWPELSRHRSLLREAQKPSEQENVLVPPPIATEYPTMPAWRALTIGFLVGVVVAVLSVFQLREWRRRAPVADPPAQRDPHPSGSPVRDGYEATSVTTRPTGQEGPRV